MRLGVLTDIHLCPPSSPPSGWHNPHQFDTVRERLAQSIAFLNRQNIDRLVVLGDSTHGGDPASLREVLALLAESTAPVWIIPGNHDLDQGPNTLNLAAADFPSIDVLDSTPQPLTDGWQVLGAGLAVAEGGGYVIEPALDAATWGATATLVLSHFPLLSFDEIVRGAGLKYAGDLVNLNAIVGPLLDRTSPTLILQGHMHVRAVQQQNAVLLAACGAQIESLFEATVLDLGENTASWQATAINPIWDGNKVDLADPTQAWTWTGSCWQRASA